MPISNQESPQLFISYCVDDKKFVYEVCQLLDPFLDRQRMFLYEEQPSLKDVFLQTIVEQAKQADCMILFVGKRFSRYQWLELATALTQQKAMCIVGIGGQHEPGDFPEEIREDASGRYFIPDRFTHSVPPDGVACAKALLEKLKHWMIAEFPGHYKPWTDEHLLYGLPKSPQLFDYEKKIIEFYAAKRVYEQEHQRAGKPTSDWADTKKRFEKVLAQWSLESIEEKLREGVPADWPKVHRYPANQPNPLDQRMAGDFRGTQKGTEALVRAGALLDLDPPGEPFTFLEAGPRPELAFPQTGGNKQLNVAILVAGGIAPGINAVIDAIVQRHHAYCGHAYELNVWGIKDGFLAIDSDNPALGEHLRKLTLEDTIEHATRGGSMLGTSRDKALLKLNSRPERLETIARVLSQGGRTFDILYIIGGDGSMKAAHTLWRMVKKFRSESKNSSIRSREMSVVAIPKTMDNDILWVWQSFGFLSAVDESRKIVETLHTEVRSNPRLGIVQLFGSDSGFVVSHAVLAAAVGHATLALIPEMGFSAIGVARYLKEQLLRAANRDQNQNNHAPIDPPIDRKFPHGLVVLAETALPLDALECLGIAGPPLEKFAAEYKDIAHKFNLSREEKEEIREFVQLRKEGRGFEGQTNDTVRQIGLRLLKEAIPIFIKSKNLLEDHNYFVEPDWDYLRVICSEPRHLVRALEPSTTDIITGQRLGLLAVDAAMAGYTDCIISQWLTEFALVPLELVVLGRKRIPRKGMFWKSVTSKTGQSSDLVSPYTLEPQA